MTMDRLSNDESVFISDEWIDQAAEQFKKAITKQLKDNKHTFGLRMSNMGRPSCQLQNEAMGTPKARREPNHILRMIIGDATEIAVSILIKAAEINVTNDKGRHEINVNGKDISGEDDIEINGKIYDIKSASPYAFTHKWADGWNGIYYSDTFGYAAQLWGYAGKDPDKMGGWIVVDKSSGEIRVVEAKPTIDQLNELEANVSKTVSALEPYAEFKKLFEPEEETYRGKPTGNFLLPKVCAPFCDYLGKCWPDAVLKPKAMSTAQEPKATWYHTYTKKTYIKKDE